MNNKALSLSLLMALAAVSTIWMYVNDIEEKNKKNNGSSVLVLVAKEDIKEHETFTKGTFTFQQRPAKYVESSAIKFEETIEDEEEKKKEMERKLRELEGSIAMVPIKKGEQITLNKIRELDIRTGLSPQVAPGRRAIAVPVTEVSGVAKLVKPGDRVDIIAIIDGGGGKENRIAKTVLQDVVVLAVGKNVTNNIPTLIEQDPYTGKRKTRSLADDSGFASVTIEVEPRQAQELALLVANGDNALMLSLRNNDDTERVAVTATGLGDVLGVDANKIQRLPAGRR